MAIPEAREAARVIIKRVRAGLPAVETPPDSFDNVVADWLKRYAEPKGLRSLPEMKRMLDSHMLPVWRHRPFVDIRRSDITKLLDTVEDKHGARAADYCLTVFSTIAGWHAARVDDYASPIIRGMRRQKISEQARDRTLSDDEIRRVGGLRDRRHFRSHRSFCATDWPSGGPGSPKCGGRSLLTAYGICRCRTGRR